MKVFEGYENFNRVFPLVSDNQGIDNLNKNKTANLVINGIKF